MRNIITINFNWLPAVSLIPAVIFLSACAWEPDLSGIGLPRVHKVDIPQGNVIEQDQINQLRPGMNKQQIRFIMGTPMLDDSFHANRWDYIYRFKPGYGDLISKQATLYFNDDDKLINIQGTFRPGDEAETTHATTEIIVVPLEDYEDDGSGGKKGWWASFVDFFAWTDEHEGIPTDGDVPVNPRGEGEATQGTMDKSPETQGI